MSMKEPAGNTAWPPPHRFRRSKKARHINLRFIPGEGVEIVLPCKPVFASEQMGLDALDRHKEWVLRQISRQAAPGRAPELNGFTNSAAPPLLPDEFALHGGSVRVRLEWGHRNLILPMPPAVLAQLPGDSPKTRVQETAAVAPPDFAFSRHPAAQSTAASPLSLLCRLKDGADAEKRKRLFLWLRKYAGAFLAARLQALSLEHAISYKELRIGWQKSRWGSYSCRGSIRLNAKLIFLPFELSDLVILHELCHATEMSHNQNFWSNLEKLEPRAKELDRQLNRAAAALPDWVKKLR